MLLLTMFPNFRVRQATAGAFWTLLNEDFFPLGHRAARLEVPLVRIDLVTALFEGGHGWNLEAHPVGLDRNHRGYKRGGPLCGETDLGKQLTRNKNALGLSDSNSLGFDRRHKRYPVVSGIPLPMSPVPAGGEI